MLQKWLAVMLDLLESKVQVQTLHFSFLVLPTGIVLPTSKKLKMQIFDYRYFTAKGFEKFLY